MTGSIPACAGEAISIAERRSYIPVYPRVCGGSWGRLQGMTADWGLSPRVRGKPGRPAGPPPLPRSIPACAGEASRSAIRTARCPVCPRVCGGSYLRGIPAYSREGLSPRVRGKRWWMRASASLAGSIPACAGEAPNSSTRAAYAWVYPRVCGGSPLPRQAGEHRRGLSPRVRGKPVQGRGLRGRRRSIPACAGEAGGDLAGRQQGKVYPRVCGGSN